jgi:hypothetical protein
MPMTLGQKVDSRIAELEVEVEKWTKIAAKYRDVADNCPACLPDGTGFMQPREWIAWAKKRLGYDKDSEAGTGGPMDDPSPPADPVR